MSANISITEGGKARPFGPVVALMVQGEDGKYYPWFPESDRALGTLSVDKNGIYRASDKGVYGWSSVSVNVPQNEGVTGKDPDTGEDVYVYPDPETGELVTDVLPVEIRVIEPPTNPYGTYVDGQTITKDGMVVKAYLESGAEYGTVPNSEITINPTVAIYDESTDRSEYTGDGIDAIRIQSSVTPIDPTAVNPVYELLGVPDGRSNTPGLDFYATTYGTKSYVASNNGFSASVTIKNSVSRIVHSGNGRFALSVDTQFWKGAVPESSTDPTNRSIDDLEPAGTGSPQTITVSWPRPGDGAVLETTFDILVGPHGGTGDD